MTTTSDGQAVAALVQSRLGRAGEWTSHSSNYGYRDSLALCVIDSVYSLRARYGSVVAVVDRYRTARRAEGGDPDGDGLHELVQAIERQGGRELFRNDAVAPGTAVRKYDVVAQLAQQLVDRRVATADEFRSALADPVDAERVRTVWCSVRGLGPASWHYVVMLAGRNDVKPDVWIARFVSKAVGADVPAARARQAVVSAAHTLGVDETALDHAIWLASRAGRV